MHKSYSANIFKNLLIWIPAISLFVAFRSIGVINPQFEAEGPVLLVAMALSVGTMAGILFGIMETISDRYLMYRLPWGKLVLLGVIAFIASFVILLLTGIIVFLSLTDHVPSVRELGIDLISANSLLLMIYLFLVGGIVDLFRIMDRKFGPGNLWRIMKGEYYSPREAIRIVMFLDMKSSTSLAESLGHLRYSSLIKDCFDDLTVVVKYKAEIYQYVGDEAVLTWTLEHGLKDLNCIRAFDAFCSRLQQRRDYYQRHYNVVPTFKAGLNSGRVVITEVGQVKREIAYHGDTINTAARIQSLCNQLNANLLLSRSLKDILPATRDYEFELTGEELLRGKTIQVEIYKARIQKPEEENKEPQASTSPLHEKIT